MKQCNMDSKPGRERSKEKRRNGGVDGFRGPNKTEDAHRGCGWKWMFELLGLAEKQVQSVTLHIGDQRK